MTYVIDSGLYSLVRHPMYSGALLVFCGIPLWLESSAGLIFSALLLIPLIV